MSPEQDSYYSRSEVSNSDLSVLAKYWQAFQISFDIEKAYRFGTLIDCMLTEPHRVNYYKFTCAGWQYTQEEFALAEAMKVSFNRDEFCRLLLQHSDMQKVTVDPNFRFDYQGFKFTLPFRMKADFNAKRVLGQIADLKSTTATTEKEFRKVVEAFHYDRQGACYMDLDRVDQFLLIGVSKKAPHSVFKVPIFRGDPLYLSGRAKLDDLAFRHYTLFSPLNIAA